MKKRYKALFAALLTGALAAGCLAGCGKMDGTAGGKMKKVTLNEVAHSIFYAPQYAAIELGYFEEEGMQTVVQVLPSLVGLMTAVGVLRASGFLEFLTHILEVPATSIGLPGPIIPIAFIRLVSNSAAVGLVLDLFKNYGPDSQVGLMASILMGSTETVLYCMSVYFGSAGISRTRYTLAGGLLAAFVSLAASVVLANQLAL